MSDYEDGMIRICRHLVLPHDIFSHWSSVEQQILLKEEPNSDA
jgi:hypothetical protein